jgi:hypothetical protein
MHSEFANLSKGVGGTGRGSDHRAIARRGGCGLGTGAGASTPALAPSPSNSNVSFGDVSLGTRAGPGQNNLNDTDSFYLSNDDVSTGTVDLSTDVTYAGLGAGDYTLVPTPGCYGVNTGTLTFTRVINASWRSTSLPTGSETAPPP